MINTNKFVDDGIAFFGIIFIITMAGFCLTGKTDLLRIPLFILLVPQVIALIAFYWFWLPNKLAEKVKFKPLAYFIILAPASLPYLLGFDFAWGFLVVMMPVVFLTAGYQIQTNLAKSN